MSRYFNQLMFIGALSSLVGISACDQANNTSELKDLASSAPIGSNAATRMIWQSPEDTQSFVFAKCTPGRLPIRKNCQEYKRYDQAAILAALNVYKEQRTAELNEVLLNTLNAAILNEPGMIIRLENSRILQNDIQVRQTEIDAVRTRIENIKQANKTLEEDRDDRLGQIALAEALMQQFPNSPEFENQKLELEIEVGVIEIAMQENLAKITAAYQDISSKEIVIEGLTEQIREINRSLVLFASRNDFSHPAVDPIKAEIDRVKRIAETYEALRKKIADDTPNFSLRLHNLQTELREVGELLLSSPLFWSSKQTIEFASAEDLINLVSPWVLEKEGERTYLATNVGNYSENANLTVELKPLSVNSNDQLKVTLKHRFQTERTFDYGIVEYRDAAGNWIQVSPRYEGDVFEWQESSFELPPLNGIENIQLRLRFQSDSSVSFRGWNIDSLTVSPVGEE